MRIIDIFVSGGSDTDRHRDLAADAINRLRQLLQYEMHLDVTINYWDYRLSTPAVVPRGAFAATSLANVDRSDALIAVFGARLPPVTQQEVDRAFNRRQLGQRVEVFVFADPRKLTSRHFAFFEQIETDYGETISFGHYTSSMTFQAVLYTTLFRYLFNQLTIASPALLSPGAVP